MIGDDGIWMNYRLMILTTETGAEDSTVEYSSQLY